MRQLKLRGRALFIEFEIDGGIPPVPYVVISGLRTLLDIRDWKMSRTHWAVKDQDLFARLDAAGLLSQTRLSRLAPGRCQSRSLRMFKRTLSERSLLKYWRLGRTARKSSTVGIRRRPIGSSHLCSAKTMMGVTSISTTWIASTAN